MKKGKASKKATKKAETVKPGMGHNSGQKIPALCKLVDELLHIAEKKKELARAERDLRNRAKSEFGILSGPLAHELKLRKMDDDVRVQFESNHQDLKVATGYQAELDFAGAQPTKASLKAQPSEAEMAKRDDAKYSVDEGEGEDDDEENTTPPGAAEGDDPLEIPENLRRKPAGVIEREG